MPAAAKNVSKTTGHGGWHPTTSTGGSSDVLINGAPAITVGISFAPHSDPNGSVHTPTANEGSGSVFINGQPACRVGDALSCGDGIADGSRNVFIGG